MESVFSLEMTPYAKETERYAIFQMTLHAWQTAAEQTLICHQSQLMQKYASG